MPFALASLLRLSETATLWPGVLLAANLLHDNTDAGRFAVVQLCRYMSPIRSASRNNGKQWPIIREAEREWAPASCNLGSSALRFVRVTFGR